MKVQTSELTGPALNWAVAVVKGINPEHIYIQGSGKWQRIYRRLITEEGNLTGRYQTGPELQFSEMWEAGGPIIEREKIGLVYYPDVNCVTHEVMPKWIGSIVIHSVTGPTPLIAAMRCFVLSRLGDEVDIPEELR